MDKLFKWLAKQDKLRAVSPLWLKKIVKGSSGIYRYNLQHWAAENPYSGTPDEWKYQAKSETKIGIVGTISQIHRHYLSACHEMGISYEVYNLYQDDWITQFIESDCKLFMVWPEMNTSLWKQIFDERIHILVNFLGKKIYPDIPGIWIYESKRRTRDWLLTHHIEHPQTWVFTDENEANQFASKCSLPVVFKTNTGAGANGVMIIKKRAELKNLIHRCFETGLIVERGDPRDRQWGCVILQEYLPDVKEWRMVRIGDSYFCRFKEKSGEFHSGSGTVSWAQPPQILLDRLRTITDENGFTSMNIDFFETTDGRYLVNEMHTVFGGIIDKNVKRNEAHMGRFKFDSSRNVWSFESGYFYQNACANLRIEYALNHIGDL